MTYSYFQAYAYKRYKNADVIFAQSMRLADDAVDYGGNFGDGSFLKSDVGVKPSILKPEVGSKVIDAMKKTEGAVYFKAEYVPDEPESSFGAIDWSSVNFDQDDRNGLSKDLNTLIDHAHLSVYCESHDLLVAKTHDERIQYFDGLNVFSKSPTISALTSGHVYDWSDKLNDVFTKDSEDVSKSIFDLGKIDDDWYVTSSSELLDSGFDSDSIYNIANVKDLNPKLQRALKPLQEEAELKNSKTPELKNVLLSSGHVSVLPDDETELGYNSNMANLRVMFSDSVRGDGSPSNIKDDILKLAKNDRVNDLQVKKQVKKPTIKTLSTDEIEF